MPLVIIQTETLSVASSIATAMEKKNLNVVVADFDDVPEKAAAKAIPQKKEVILDMPKPAELKETLTEVKEELGVEALKDLLTVHDATSLKTLAKPEWPTIWAEAKNLLKEANEELGGELEEEDDLGLGLDDDDELDNLGDDLDMGDDDLGLGDEDAPDLATVKKLASKFADKHGIELQREIMSKFGIPTTRSLGKADEEQRTKIFNGLTKKM